jgi:hypothetical protein
MSSALQNSSAVLIFNHEVEQAVAKQWMKNHGQLCDILRTGAIQKTYDAKASDLVELWNLNLSSEKLKADIRALEQALEAADDEIHVEKAHNALKDADRLLEFLQARMKALGSPSVEGADGWVETVQWWKPVYENAMYKAMADETSARI